MSIYDMLEKSTPVAQKRKRENKSVIKSLVEGNKELLEKNKEYKREIEKLNHINEQLEKKIKLICEMYYEDKETQEMEQWIKELKEKE